MARISTIALTGFAFAAGLVGTHALVHAQPRLVQTGDGYSVAYDGDGRGDAVGGGDARLSGGGDNATILYTGPDTARGTRFASIAGGGDNAVIGYAEPAASATAAPVAMAGGAARPDAPRG